MKQNTKKSVKSTTTTTDRTSTSSGHKLRRSRTSLAEVGGSREDAKSTSAVDTPRAQQRNKSASGSFSKAKAGKKQTSRKKRVAFSVDDPDSEAAFTEPLEDTTLSSYRRASQNVAHSKSEMSSSGSALPRKPPGSVHFSEDNAGRADGLRCRNRTQSPCSVASDAASSPLRGLMRVARSMEDRRRFLHLADGHRPASRVEDDDDTLAVTSSLVEGVSTLDDLERTAAACSTSASEWWPTEHTSVGGVDPQKYPEAANIVDDRQTSYLDEIKRADDSFHQLDTISEEILSSRSKSERRDLTCNRRDLDDPGRLSNGRQERQPDCKEVGVIPGQELSGADPKLENLSSELQDPPSKLEPHKNQRETNGLDPLNGLSEVDPVGDILSDKFIDLESGKILAHKVSEMCLSSSWSAGEENGNSRSLKVTASAVKTKRCRSRSSSRQRSTQDQLETEGGSHAGKTVAHGDNPVTGKPELSAGESDHDASEAFHTKTRTQPGSRGSEYVRQPNPFSPFLPSPEMRQICVFHAQNSVGPKREQLQQPLPPTLSSTPVSVHTGSSFQISSAESAASIGLQCDLSDGSSLYSLPSSAMYANLAHVPSLQVRVAHDGRDPLTYDDDADADAVNEISISDSGEESLLSLPEASIGIQCDRSSISSAYSRGNDDSTSAQVGSYALDQSTFAGSARTLGSNVAHPFRYVASLTPGGVLAAAAVKLIPMMSDYTSSDGAVSEAQIPKINEDQIGVDHGNQNTSLGDERIVPEKARSNLKDGNARAGTDANLGGFESVDERPRGVEPNRDGEYRAKMVDGCTQDHIKKRKMFLPERMNSRDVNEGLIPTPFEQIQPTRKNNSAERILSTQKYTISDQIQISKKYITDAQIQPSQKYTSSEQVQSSHENVSSDHVQSLQKCAPFEQGQPSQKHLHVDQKQSAQKFIPSEQTQLSHKKLPSDLIPSSQNLYKLSEPIQTGQKNTLAEQMKSGLKYITVDQIQSEQKNTPVDQLQSGQIYIPVDHIKSGQKGNKTDRNESEHKYNSIDLMPAGQKYIPVDQIQSGQKNISADQIQSGQKHIPDDQRQSGQKNIPIDQIQSGKKNIPADQIQSGQKHIPDDQRQSGQKNIPIDQIQSGKKNIPAYQIQSGQKNIPVDQIQSGQKNIPVDQIQSGQIYIPVDQIKPGQKDNKTDRNESEHKYNSIDFIPAGEKYIPVDLIQSGQKNMPINQIQSGQKYIPADQIQSGHKNIPFDQIKSEQKYTPIDQIQAGQKYIPVDQIQSGPKYTPVDQIQSGQTNIPVNQIQSGQKYIPVDQIKSGQKYIPVDQIQSGQKNMPINQIQSGQKNISVDQIQSGQKSIPIDQIQSGQKSIPIDQIQSGQKYIPADQIQSGHKNIPFDQIKSEQKYIPIDQIQSGQKNIPVNQIQSGQKSIPIDQIQSGQKYIPADQIQLGHKNISFDQIKSEQKYIPIDKIQSGQKYIPVDQIKSEPKYTPVDQIQSGQKNIPVNQIQSGQKYTPVDQIQSGHKNITFDQIKSEQKYIPIDQIQSEQKYTPVDQIQSGQKCTPVDQIQSGQKYIPADQIQPGQKSIPIDQIQSGQKYIPVDQIQSGQKNIPVDQIQSGQKYIPVDQIQTGQKNIPFDQIQSGQKYIPADQILSGQKYIPVDQKWSGQKNIPVDQIQSGQKNSPVEQIQTGQKYLSTEQSGQKYIPVDQIQSGEKYMPVDQIQTGQKYISVGQIQSVQKYSPVDQIQSGQKNIPVDQVQSGQKYIPVDQIQSGQKYLSTEQSGKKYIPADQIQSGQKYIPADQIQSGQKYIPADQIQSGQKYITADQVQSGQKYITADQVQSGQKYIPLGTIQAGLKDNRIEQIRLGQNSFLDKRILSGHTYASDEYIQSGKIYYSNERIQSEQKYSPVDYIQSGQKSTTVDEIEPGQKYIPAEKIHSRHNYTPVDQIQSVEKYTPKNQTQSGHKYIPNNQIQSGQKYISVDQINSGQKHIPVDQIQSGHKYTPVDQIHSGQKYIPVDQIQSGQKYIPVDQIQSRQKYIPADQIQSGQKYITVNQIQSGQKYVSTEQSGKKYIPADQIQSEQKYIPVDQIQSGQKYIPADQIQSGQKYIPVDQIQSGQKYIPVDQIQSGQKYIPADQIQSGQKYIPADLIQSVQKYIPVDQIQSGQKYIPVDQIQSGQKYIPVDQIQSGQKYIPVDQIQSGQKYIPVDQIQSGQKYIPVDQIQSGQKFIPVDQIQSGQKYIPVDQKQSGEKFTSSDVIHSIENIISSRHRYMAPSKILGSSEQIDTPSILPQPAQSVQDYDKAQPGIMQKKLDNRLHQDHNMSDFVNSKLRTESEEPNFQFSERSKLLGNETWAGKYPAMAGGTQPDGPKSKQTHPLVDISRTQEHHDPPNIAARLVDTPTGNLVNDTAHAGQVMTSSREMLSAKDFISGSIRAKPQWNFPDYTGFSKRLLGPSEGTMGSHFRSIGIKPSIKTGSGVVSKPDGKKIQFSEPILTNQTDGRDVSATSTIHARILDRGLEHTDRRRDKEFQFEKIIDKALDIISTRDKKINEETGKFTHSLTKPLPPSLLTTEDRDRGWKTYRSQRPSSSVDEDRFFRKSQLPYSRTEGGAINKSLRNARDSLALLRYTSRSMSASDKRGKNTARVNGAHTSESTASGHWEGDDSSRNSMKNVRFASGTRTPSLTRETTFRTEQQDKNNGVRTNPSLLRETKFRTQQHDKNGHSRSLRMDGQGKNSQATASISSLSDGAHLKANTHTKAASVATPAKPASVYSDDRNLFIFSSMPLHSEKNSGGTLSKESNSKKRIASREHMKDSVPLTAGYHNQRSDSSSKSKLRSGRSGNQNEADSTSATRTSASLRQNRKDGSFRNAENVVSGSSAAEPKPNGMGSFSMKLSDAQGTKTRNETAILSFPGQLNSCSTTRTDREYNNKRDCLIPDILKRDMGVFQIKRRTVVKESKDASLAEKQETLGSNNNVKVKASDDNSYDSKSHPGESSATSKRLKGHNERVTPAKRVQHALAHATAKAANNTTTSDKTASGRDATKKIRSKANRRAREERKRSQKVVVPEQLRDRSDTNVCDLMFKIPKVDASVPGFTSTSETLKESIDIDEQVISNNMTQTQDMSKGEPVLQDKILPLDADYSVTKETVKVKPALLEDFYVISYGSSVDGYPSPMHYVTQNAAGGVATYEDMSECSHQLKILHEVGSSVDFDIAEVSDAVWNQSEMIETKDALGSSFPESQSGALPEQNLILPDSADSGCHGDDEQKQNLVSFSEDLSSSVYNEEIVGKDTFSKQEPMTCKYETDGNQETPYGSGISSKDRCNDLKRKVPTSVSGAQPDHSCPATVVKKKLVTLTSNATETSKNSHVRCKIVNQLVKENEVLNSENSSVRSQAQPKVKTHGQFPAAGVVQIPLQIDVQTSTTDVEQSFLRSEVQSSRPEVQSSTLQSEIRSTILSEVQSVGPTEEQSTVFTEAKSTIDTEMLSTLQNEVQSSIHSEVLSGVQQEAHTPVQYEAKSRVESEVQSTIHTEVQIEGRSSLQSEVLSSIQSEVQSLVPSQEQSLVPSQVQSEVQSPSQSQSHSRSQSPAQPGAPPSLEYSVQSELQLENPDQRDDSTAKLQLPSSVQPSQKVMGIHRVESQELIYDTLSKLLSPKKSSLLAPIKSPAIPALHQETLHRIQTSAESQLQADDNLADDSGLGSLNVSDPSKKAEGDVTTEKMSRDLKYSTEVLTCGAASQAQKSKSRLQSQPPGVSTDCYYYEDLNMVHLTVKPFNWPYGSMQCRRNQPAHSLDIRFLVSHRDEQSQKEIRSKAIRR